MMKCSPISSNDNKAMNARYYSFEIRFYDVEENEGMGTKTYKTYGRAMKAVSKAIRGGHPCSLVGRGFGAIVEEIGCC